VEVAFFLAIGLITSATNAATFVRHRGLGHSTDEKLANLFGV
jgi:hypothetical protein